MCIGSTTSGAPRGGSSPHPLLKPNPCFKVKCPNCASFFFALHLILRGKLDICGDVDLFFALHLIKQLEANHDNSFKGCYLFNPPSLKHAGCAPVHNLNEQINSPGRTQGGCGTPPPPRRQLHKTYMV